MLCPSCGKEIPDTAKSCQLCGQPVAAATKSAGRGTASGAPGPAQTSGLAIASLVCGLVVVFLLAGGLGSGFAPAVILALAAGGAGVILGHRARRRIGESGGRLKGSKVALAGLILSYSWFAALVLVLVVSELSHLAPRPRTAANEASAVGSLRQYVNGCIAYSNAHPKLGYPANLSVLGPAPAGEDLLDPVLAPPGGVNTAAKSGYTFLYTPGRPDRRGVIASFTLTARPEKNKYAGRRSFFVDETGVIRFTREDRAATAHDPPIS